MHRILFLIITITAIYSCKKDFPIDNDTNATPVFSFKGTINNIPVEINGGNNNYYMYSSFVQDSFGVYSFIGELKQTNCSNCPNSVKLQIKDDSISASNASVQINAALKPAYYSIQGINGTPTKYEYTFVAQPDLIDTVKNYFWDFGDGTTSTSGPTVVHAYKHPGYYNVCLRIDYTNSCSSNICNEIKFGVPNAGYTGNIIDSCLAGNQINFTANYSGNGINYLWDFGDGNTSNVQNPSHIYSNPGIYKVCLQVVDVNNTVFNICKNVTTTGYTASCLTNFDHTSVVYINNLGLSNIIISWTDNAGVVYSSDKIAQPSDSYFQILSVEDYLTNENAEPTKKIHAKLKCTLSNGSSTIQISNGNAIMAISYK